MKELPKISNTEIPRKQRKRVKERDGNKCVVCWRKYQLSIHHFYDWNQIEGFQESCRNEFLDFHLITLCQSCHAKAHTYDRESPLFKLLVDIVKTNMINRNMAGKG